MTITNISSYPRFTFHVNVCSLHNKEGKLIHGVDFLRRLFSAFSFLILRRYFSYSYTKCDCIWILMLTVPTRSQLNAVNQIQWERIGPSPSYELERSFTKFSIKWVQNVKTKTSNTSTISKNEKKEHNYGSSYEMRPFRPRKTSFRFFGIIFIANGDKTLHCLGYRNFSLCEPISNKNPIRSIFLLIFPSSLANT